MSEEFNKFLQEYNADGREKLDGYTLPNFDHFLPDEKIQAIGLLKSEVIKNGWGIEALAYLDKSVAVEALKIIVETWSDEKLSRAFVVFYWLYKLTNKEIFAEKFCECREYLDSEKFHDDVLGFYVYAGRMGAAEPVNNLLRAAVFTESERLSLGVAVQALLENQGLSFEDAATKFEYSAKRKILMDGTENQKQLVLQQLKK